MTLTVSSFRAFWHPENSFTAESRNSLSREAENLEHWVSRIGKDHILRSTKKRKCVHTKLRTLEPWVSRLGKSRIFKSPKCKKMSSHEDTHTWTVSYKTRHTSYFQAAKMQKTGYRSPWNVRFTKRQKFRFQDTHVVCDWPWPLTFEPGHEFGLFGWPLNFKLELKVLEFQPPRASLYSKDTY